MKLPITLITLFLLLNSLKVGAVVIEKQRSIKGDLEYVPAQAQYTIQQKQHC